MNRPAVIACLLAAFALIPVSPGLGREADTSTAQRGILAAPELRSIIDGGCDDGILLRLTEGSLQDFGRTKPIAMITTPNGDTWSQGDRTSFYPLLNALCVSVLADDPPGEYRVSIEFPDGKTAEGFFNYPPRSAALQDGQSPPSEEATPVQGPGRAIAHTSLTPADGSHVTGGLTFVQAGDPSNIRTQHEPLAGWFGAMVAGQAEGLAPSNSYGLFLWAESECAGASANFVGKPWLLVGDAQGRASQALSATAIGFPFAPRSVSLHESASPQPMAACGHLELDPDSVYPF